MLLYVVYARISPWEGKRVGPPRSGVHARGNARCEWISGCCTEKGLSFLPKHSFIQAPVQFHSSSSSSSSSSVLFLFCCCCFVLFCLFVLFVFLLCFSGGEGVVVVVVVVVLLLFFFFFVAVAAAVVAVIVVVDVDVVVDDVDVVDRFYVALVSALEQTLCTRM